MKFSFSICTIPWEEEYHNGVSSNYKAYVVDVPDELFPEELLEVLKNQGKIIKIPNCTQEPVLIPKVAWVSNIIPIKE